MTGHKRQAPTGRTFLFVLDSLGIGHAPDAGDYDNDGVPDNGANTLGHIAEYCATGRCDGRAEYAQPPRDGALHLPNLSALGLGLAAARAAAPQTDGAQVPPGLAPPEGQVRGQYAALIETSRGKDTPSGHYELCGVPVDFDWGYFPRAVPCFPATLTDALVAQSGLPGVLGNRHASGTEIIAALGAEHLASGKPIIYTSADSVFQIAAHEEHFGLERLYALCAIARRLCDPLRIGRVIARPFVGDARLGFVRTGNRRDLAVPPPGFTLLDAFAADDRERWSIGKIGDIFDHRNTGREVHAHGLGALVDATLDAAAQAQPGALVFTNFVDFDSAYGHRRNVGGYASALEYFDSRLPALMATMGAGDLMVLAADHGNDPAWVGTDHTREQVPMLVWQPDAGFTPGPLTDARGFLDCARLIARHARLSHGFRKIR